MSQQPYGQQNGRPMPPTYGSGQQQPYGSQQQGGSQPYGSQQHGAQQYGSQQYGAQPYGSQPAAGSQPYAAQSYGAQGQPYGAQGQPFAGASPYAQQPVRPAIAPGQPLPENAYAEGSAMFWQSTDSERAAAMWTHIGAIFISWLMPLIMFLVKKDESAFVREHARQSLNAQIMNAIAMAALSIIITIITVVTFGFGAVFFGFIYLPWIFYAVFEIIAAVRANKGEGYRIPLAPNMVK